MNPIFVVVAALMAALALACLLLPLLWPGKARRAPTLAVALCFIVPLGALGLYAWIGTPAALIASATANATQSPHMNLAAATQKLQAQLTAHPDDANGWVLLGRSYEAMHQSDKALAALQHALKLKPDDPTVIVMYVKAAALQHSDHRIDGDLARMLHKALKADPQNQHGLWLLGISQYQVGDFAAAITTWKQLLALLPQNSEVAANIQAQITRATRAAGGTPPAAAASLATTAPPAAAAPAPTAATIEVHIALAPSLRGKVAGDDTVFVFAHALNGPPMPVAVARLHASDLPTTVRLTDAMSMSPQLKLSMFAKVSVSARVSMSGNALPHSGDLQADAADVTVGARAPVQLSINHALP